MIEQHSLPLLLCIGAATGTITGLTGAGMSVFVSSLLLLGTPVREVIGVSFAVTLVNATIAAVPFARKDNIPIKPAAVMALSAVLMVLPGYRFSRTFSSEILSWCLITGLLFIGIRLVFFSTTADGGKDKRSQRFHTVFLIIPGAVAGGIMGILGGGGALLMSLMLIFIFYFPVHKALGITFVAMALASVPGLYLYGNDGFISYTAVAALIVPSAICSYIAARFTSTLSERYIKRFLGIYLLVISLFLIIKEAGFFF